MKKELEKLEFAEGYSKIGELKEGLEKFLISCGNNMTVCYTYSNKLIEIYGGDIMLENIPSQSTMTELLGQPLFEVWQELCSAIDEKYEMERLWNTGGKNWTYEYKYRRGGKTLCSLYAKSNCVGFMIIFGKDERAKFEDIIDTLSAAVCRQYDEAQTYHDGKWVMFEPANTSEFDDYIKMLAIKRKPNRK